MSYDCHVGPGRTCGLALNPIATRGFYQGENFDMGDNPATLVEKVASVFRSPLVDKIDFHFHPEGLHVNSLRLRAVGEAISKGRIGVEISSTGTILSAAYSPHSNKMTLPDEKVTGTGIGRSGILHEGVHALVDLYKCTSTTKLTDEAAAYLARVAI